jgi:hypothetical protein
VKLTQKQQNALLEWAAEGLRLQEINERAAEFDPPFEVEWLQLKHARRRAGKSFTELREQLEAEAIGEGLARRAARIRQLEALYDKHLELIHARGVEMFGQGTAGGETGLIVRDYKGKDADRPIYKYDAALIREMRGLLDDIAREIGDRRTKIDMTTKVDVTKLTDAELEAIIEAEGGSGA